MLKFRKRLTTLQQSIRFADMEQTNTPRFAYFANLSTDALHTTLDIAEGTLSDCLRSVANEPDPEQVEAWDLQISLWEDGIAALNAELAKRA